MYVYVCACVCQQDPAKRATAQQILSHDWFVNEGMREDVQLDSVVLKRMHQFAQMNKLKKMCLMVVGQQLSADEIAGACSIVSIDYYAWRCYAKATVGRSVSAMVTMAQPWLPLYRCTVASTDMRPAYLHVFVPFAAIAPPCLYLARKHCTLHTHVHYTVPCRTLSHHICRAGATLYHCTSAMAEQLSHSRGCPCDGALSPRVRCTLLSDSTSGPNSLPHHVCSLPVFTAEELHSHGCPCLRTS